MSNNEPLGGGDCVDGGQQKKDENNGKHSDGEQSQTAEASQRSQTQRSPSHAHAHCGGTFNPVMQSNAPYQQVYYPQQQLVQPHPQQSAPVGVPGSVYQFPPSFQQQRYTPVAPPMYATAPLTGGGFEYVTSPGGFGNTNAAPGAYQPMYYGGAMQPQPGSPNMVQAEPPVEEEHHGWKSPLTWTLIGLCLSWIPIIGFITYCANWRAPKGSRRKTYARAALLVAVIITLLNLFVFNRK